MARTLLTLISPAFKIARAFSTNRTFTTMGSHRAPLQTLTRESLRHQRAKLGGETSSGRSLT
jgi:hypothetical protein